MNIEPLEARIAPASAFVIYTDADGDLVKITAKVAGSTAPPLDLADLTFTGGGTSGQLALLNLTDAGFQNAAITIAVTKKAGGDGFTSIGTIDATGRDLGKVAVKGDLGEIDAGDADTATAAIKSLTVQSFGFYGTTTGATADVEGTSESLLTGALGALTVKTDFINNFLHVVGGGTAETHAQGRIGPITIGGSISGSAFVRGGLIEANGDIGAIKIRGGIIGGSATSSGGIQSDYGKVASVTLGGDLTGGTAQFTGNLRAAAGFGAVKIGGDMTGGAVANSGIIASDTGFGADGGSIASVTIRGELTGNLGAGSGLIRSSADLGPVQIGGAVTTSSILADAGVLGSITVGDSMDSCIIRGRDGIGNLKIGAGLSLAQINTNAGAIGHITVGGNVGLTSIQAFAEIGNVKITGAVIFGGIGTNGGTLGQVTLGGLSAANIFGSTGIGKVKIAGDMEIGSSIRAAEGSIAGVTVVGKSLSSTIAAGRNLGPVKITGDVTGSTISAGVEMNFPVVGKVGRLASLTVGGSLDGAVSATDGIGAVKIGGDLTGTIRTLAATNVQTVSDIKSVTIGQSLDGGGIASLSNLGAVKIVGDLKGADFTAASPILRSGYIEAGGRIASVAIDGSILAGVDSSSQTPERNATIRAGYDLGALTIKGDVIGRADSGNGATPVIISAFTQLAFNPAKGKIALGRVTIGGDVEQTRILAGYTISGDAFNGDASIGAVKITGNWTASSLVAGVQDGGAAGFGTDGDSIINDSGLTARIASITIGGVVAGTATAGDHFGFVAEQIGSFKMNGFTADLAASVEGENILIPGTDDVRVREY